LAVDRKSIDEGTPTADAATIDVEDYAVLFAIDRARARRQRSRPRRGRRYDCLVVDEVQELAPIELALIARSLRPGGTLVVAGDENQRIDPGATFLGWPETMRALRRPDYAHVVLDVSYRCPPEVVALARHALGQVTLERPRLPLTQFDSLPALVVWLARHAGGLLDADPNATIGVFTRSPLAARRIADDLARAIPVRLVWGGDFRFAPGVDVTTIDQVRGLEFDHVVIADGSSRTYGDDSASRRALYVAVTRAKKTVRLASVGVPTVIFAPS
jgi:DNA helicase IV